MYIVYYDESGDDGVPGSSKLFLLSAVALHHQNWHDTYSQLQSFRSLLKAQHRIPIRTEFHTRPFLLNKNPYRDLSLSDDERLLILDKWCEFLGNQSALMITNVAINKTAVPSEGHYPVLDNAVTFSVQRIENTLKNTAPGEKFLIITDDGRIGAMRKTTRRIQKVNFIPSKIDLRPYRQEISLMIEDPLPKKSAESYFIQVADLISYVVATHLARTKLQAALGNRLPKQLDDQRIRSWMEKLKPVLNLKASTTDPYGIVCYPK